MKDYRPLLLQTLDVRLPGLRVLRLRLNRHLPEADALERHSHKFSQTLCYLSGRGILEAAAESRSVLPGMVAFLPAGLGHGFRETSGRRPLTLAVDFEYRAARKPGLCVAHLNDSESARIRQYLSGISRIRNPSSPESRLLAASAALAILDIQFRALGLLPGREATVPGFVRKFRLLAADPDNALLGISELARKTGFQTDYLNRRHKQATGLTLRQQRDTLRLEKAGRLLKHGLSVAEAADGAGFGDPNYFTRWFKRQTGLPPARWRDLK